MSSFFRQKSIFPDFSFLLSLENKIWLALFSFLLSLVLTILPSNHLLAQTPPILNSGQKISLNGRQFNFAWIQWYQGDVLHTALSDVGATQIFGLDLLNTNQASIQPINWFAEKQSLKTILISPFRYLDVTNLPGLKEANLVVEKDVLFIETKPVVIENIRLQGKTIEVYLNRPTFWQVSQFKDEGVITIDGVAPAWLQRLFPQMASTSIPVEEDEEMPSKKPPLPTRKPRLGLETTATQTRLRVNLLSEKNLRITSKSNPNRLIIEPRPDALVERHILWADGLYWHQKYIKLNNNNKNNLFPVVWLEIKPHSSNISLQPITNKSDKLEGIFPLVNTATASEVVAAINGGFFNRNNQLPLGAIRRNGEWLSGPILNRGAIAWDNQGVFKITHLSLEEVLTTEDGNHLPISFFNSAYVQEGIARYTRAWGKNYTPFTKNEVIISVENNRVISIQGTQQNSPRQFIIPENGYLLAIRSNKNINIPLNVGTNLSIKSQTKPPYLQAYPNIIGAGPILLKNGKLVLNALGEKFNSAFDKQAASRSAIALTRRNSLIIAAVHNGVFGKAPTLKEFAYIMQHLGAIDALNLDGGSSTSLYLGGSLIDRNPTTAARVHNGIGIFIKEDTK